MKEFMPDTHADPALIRAYAAPSTWKVHDEELTVQLDFGDIATDRGPRMETTLDMYPAQIPPYAWGPETWTRKREIEPYERKLTRGEQAALDRANEDSLVFEHQLWTQNNDPFAQGGGDDDDD